MAVNQNITQPILKKAYVNNLKSQTKVPNMVGTIGKDIYKNIEVVEELLNENDYDDVKDLHVNYGCSIDTNFKNCSNIQNTKNLGEKYIKLDSINSVSNRNNALNYSSYPQKECSYKDNTYCGGTYKINLESETERWFRLKGETTLSDNEFISYLLNMYELFVIEKDMEIIDTETSSKSVDIGIQVSVITENSIPIKYEAQNYKAKLNYMWHHNLTIYSCEKCEYITSDLNLLNIHLSENKGHTYVVNKSKNLPRKFEKICPICNVKCFSERTLKSHHKRNHVDLEYFCNHPGCSFKSIFRNSYETHMKYQHDESAKFICEKCGNDFRRPDQLRLHSKVHLKADGRIIRRQGEVIKPLIYECNMCKKSFKTEIGKKIHDFSFHSSSFKFDGYFICPKFESCYFKSENFRSVHQHCTLKCFKSIIGDINYKCSFCGSLFFNKLGLYNHERRHKLEKRHRCTVCQRYFLTKGELIRHSNIHTKEKPYRCKICNQNFRLNAILNRHMLTHTGRKPHKCQTCDAAFADSNTLKHHEQKKHGIE